MLVDGHEWQRWGRTNQITWSQPPRRLSTRSFSLRQRSIQFSPSSSSMSKLLVLPLRRSTFQVYEVGRALWGNKRSTRVEALPWADSFSEKTSKETTGSLCRRCCGSNASHTHSCRYTPWSSRSAFVWRQLLLYSFLSKNWICPDCIKCSRSNHQ